MEGPDWPVSAPYVTLAGINLLVCDLTSGTGAMTLLVPVKREIEGTNGNHGATLLAVAAGGNTLPTGLAADFGALNAFTA